MLYSHLPLVSLQVTLKPAGAQLPQPHQLLLSRPTPSFPSILLNNQVAPSSEGTGVVQAPRQCLEVLWSPSEGVSQPTLLSSICVLPTGHSILGIDLE